MALPIRHQRRLCKQFAPDIYNWTQAASDALAKMAGENAVMRSSVVKLIELCRDSGIPTDQVEAALIWARNEAAMTLEATWIAAAAEHGLDLAQVLDVKLPS